MELSDRGVDAVDAWWMVRAGEPAQPTLPAGRYVPSVLIGAHVRAGGQLLPALSRAHAIGADVVQVFTQSPRAWRPTQYAPEVLARYRQAQSEDPSVAATYCHATYLVNLATPDRALLERSTACLVANLTAARGMGAAGLVLHIGSHRGQGAERSLRQVAAALRCALEEPDPWGSPGRRPALRCPILLENAAGAGDTVGRSFEELATVLDLAGAGDALGVCLDTQHLWSSGVGFGSPGEADEVVASLDRTVGLDALRCLHLNDSKVPRGANRDRHANIGEGSIGEESLAWLLGHPRLAGLPAILEVPGSGEGPRAEDVAVARRTARAGRRLWKGIGSAREPY